MILVLVKMAMLPCRGRRGSDNKLGSEFPKSYDYEIENAKVTDFKRLKGDVNVDATRPV